MTDTEYRLSTLENTVGQMRAMLADQGYCFSDLPGTDAPEFMTGGPKHPVHTYEEAKKVAERVHKEMTMDAKDPANVLLLCNLARLKQERDELLRAVKSLLVAIQEQGFLFGGPISDAEEKARELIAKVEKSNG